MRRLRAAAFHLGGLGSQGSVCLPKKMFQSVLAFINWTPIKGADDGVGTTYNADKAQVSL